MARYGATEAAAAAASLGDLERLQLQRDKSYRQRLHDIRRSIASINLLLLRFGCEYDDATRRRRQPRYIPKSGPKSITPPDEVLLPPLADRKDGSIPYEARRRRVASESYPAAKHPLNRVVIDESRKHRHCYRRDDLEIHWLSPRCCMKRFVGVEPAPRSPKHLSSSATVPCYGSANVAGSRRRRDPAHQTDQRDDDTIRDDAINGANPIVSIGERLLSLTLAVESLSELHNGINIAGINLKKRNLERLARVAGDDVQPQ